MMTHRRTQCSTIIYDLIADAGLSGRVWDDSYINIPRYSAVMSGICKLPLETSPMVVSSPSPTEDATRPNSTTNETSTKASANCPHQKYVTHLKSTRHPVNFSPFTKHPTFSDAFKKYRWYPDSRTNIDPKYIRSTLDKYL
ncbi:unnamed protein product [Meganyctiphanes norvegica]|uniref:Uncharacterized protein n=1 Tax=Meganyctiphanes norvegica TaxID=48144 RepID=A0AAV2S6M7_MEGNR